MSYEWRGLTFDSLVRVIIRVIGGFFAFELIVFVSKYCNNILLHSGDRALKLPRYTNNFVIFDYGFVHEALAVGNVVFLEVVNLVTYSLRPSLGMKDLTIDGEQVLNIFGVEKSASRSGR